MALATTSSTAEPGKTVSGGHGNDTTYGDIINAGTGTDTADGNGNDARTAAELVISC